MSEVLDISVSVSNMYWVVIATLSANQGDAVKEEMNLHINDNRN